MGEKSLPDYKGWLRSVVGSEDDSFDQILSSLTPREAFVINRRLGLSSGQPESLEAIGEALGMEERGRPYRNIDRIRNTVNQALSKLGHPGEVPPNPN